MAGGLLEHLKKLFGEVYHMQINISSGDDVGYFEVIRPWIKYVITYVDTESVNISMLTNCYQQSIQQKSQLIFVALFVPIS